MLRIINIKNRGSLRILETYLEKRKIVSKKSN